jgi:hypothetical protein
VSGEQYKVGTIADMARIPAEALPRFLAELPAILSVVRAMQAAAPDLAKQAKAKAPWPLSLLSERMFVRFFVSALDHGRYGTWVDDDKGMATISMRTKASSEPFFSRSEKMGAPE